MLFLRFLPKCIYIIPYLGSNMEAINYDDVEKMFDLALFLKWVMKYHPELMDDYIKWRGY